MENTYFGVDDAKERQKLESLATGYRWEAESESFIELLWKSQLEESDCGEMISNVSDFTRFLRTMIGKTRPVSERGHKEVMKS
jgi:hypothetical protein